MEKSTDITENLKLLFRVEAFNIADRAEFRRLVLLLRVGNIRADIGTYDPRILRSALRLKLTRPARLWTSRNTNGGRLPHPS